jgi:septal ring factor EnvC (AmiA/AmiB activator)
MGAAVQLHAWINLETIECCRCGCTFAVTAPFLANLLKTKQSFYCPNGHSQSYTESTEERLRKELAEKERSLQWEQERVASLNKQLKREQTASKKLKRRVSVGVCPCCQRTVSQLARHMETQHPEFIAENKAATK